MTTSETSTVQIGADEILRTTDGYAFAMFRMYRRADEEEGAPYVVLFEAWEIFGIVPATGRLLFGDGVSPVGDGNPREDNRLLSGFIKFDGCMQGHWEDEQLGFHFDYPKHIDQLHALLRAIHSKGMEIMWEKDE